jgi:hypothetical protein
VENVGVECVRNSCPSADGCHNCNNWENSYEIQALIPISLSHFQVLVFIGGGLLKKVGVCVSEAAPGELEGTHSCIH